MAASWIIPCNVKYFNVVEHFKSNNVIYWKRGAGEKVGDFVYVYVGTPYKQIMYRCIVLDDQVDNETMAKNTYATKGNKGSAFNRYMKLQKDYSFSTPISLQCLQELGITMIRKQIRAGRLVEKYIESEYTDMPLYE